MMRQFEYFSFVRASASKPQVLVPRGVAGRTMQGNNTVPALAGTCPTLDRTAPLSRNMILHMAGQRDSIIGLGVYTVDEAALYGQLTPGRVRSWAFGTTRSSPLIVAPMKERRLVTFHDLIQLMAINRARDAGAPLQKIRQAMKHLANEGIDLPLAHKHKMYWFDGHLYIGHPGKRMTQVSAPRGQQVMREIAKKFREDLRFDAAGLSIEYTAHRFEDRKIVLNPEFEFGQPVVQGTGYRADVLYDAYLAEDKSVEMVTYSFGVEPKDVRAAADYFESLKAA